MMREKCFRYSTHKADMDILCVSGHARNASCSFHQITYIQRSASDCSTETEIVHKSRSQTA
jgi:hypothetical protein